MKYEADSFVDQRSPGYCRLQKTLASFTILTTLTALMSCQSEASYKQPSVQTADSATSPRSISEVILPPVRAEFPVENYNLPVYYGDECQEAASQAEANMISMDYANVASNIYTGADNLSLKDGLIRRVRQAVSTGNKDYQLELTDQQQDVIAASVDGLVEQTYGNDILPDNRLYYVSVASFYNPESDRPANLIDTKKSQDDLPVYVIPELNYCVFNLTEAQIQ